MADLSSLSVEELLAMKQGASAMAQPTAVAQPMPDLSSLSTAELLAMKNSSVNRDWNVLDSAKNFGSGVVEGTTGMLGLAADLNPFQPGGPRLNFPVSQAVSSTIDPLLAEKDPQYRYARTIGNFAAPVPIKGANTLGSLLTGVLSGVSAQGAEDLTGDKKVAPLIGAVGVGGAVSAASNIGSLLERALIGSSADEVLGSAASSFKEVTGLTPDDLAKVNALPTNELEALQTTAERTGNAGVAQLEKTLGGRLGDNANIYADLDRRRNLARRTLFNSGSSVDSVNKEGLGSALIDAAESTQSKMQRNSSEFWAGVPREESIPIQGVKDPLKELLAKRTKGLPINSKVEDLVSQVTKEESGVLNSGGLQDIRADALSLLRDRELTGFERKLLTELTDKIDNSMASGLSEKSYQTWKAARQSTAAEKEAFRKGTVGGYLTSDNARVSNVLDKVFKGDKQAVAELKTAIGNDDSLLEQVKRGVLDMVPKDAQGNLTSDKMRRFVDSNETAIKELFGEGYYGNLQKISKDLKSQAGVADLGFKASKGNSTTAQKSTVAGALQDVITESLVPGISGRFSGVIEAIKQGAGLRDAKAVEDLLFKAALDPKFAEQLSRAPTNRRMFNALESLKNAAIGAVETGAIMGTKELSRDQDNRTPLAKLLDSVTSEPAPTAQSKSTLQKVLGASGASMDPVSFDTTQDFPLMNTLLKGDTMDAPVADIMEEIKKDPVDHAIMLMESNGDPKAKNPTSSASGLFQLIKGTAESLGVTDVFDPADNYAGYKKLKADTIKQFGTDDVATIYASHYLGAPTLKKWLDGKELTKTQAEQVKYLQTTLLPRLAKIYGKLVNEEKVVKA